MKCSACGQRYEPDNIDVLGHRKDLWFFSVYCSSCRTQYLIVAIVTKGEVREFITDLSESELEKFQGVDSVTADEVLEMHSFLKGFDGDFSRLFEQKPV